MTSLINGYSKSLNDFMKINNSMYDFFQNNELYEENYEIYDLMISLKEDKSLNKLMNEIKHYINLINKKNG